MYSQQSQSSRTIAALLALAMICSACASSVVQIKPPYSTKLRTGDGVKILDKGGVLHSGRVVYLDAKVVVLRTPRQTITNSPVKSAKFGTSIPWETVKSIRVAGTLDSQNKLISNEEIRINRRTNLRQKMMANMGLLGLATSFLIGSAIQESMAPADPANLTGNHGRARFSFWTTVLAGTAASIGAGYRMGKLLDNKYSVNRIERARADLRRKQVETASIPEHEGVYGRPIAK